MNPERVRAYKRVVRSWQRAGMDDTTIAHTIVAMSGCQCDPFALDTALSSAAALDTCVARQTSEAPGPVSRGL